MRARTRERVLARQSPSSLILASISPEGDSGLAFFAAGFFAACFLAFPFWIIGFFLPMRANDTAAQRRRPSADRCYGRLGRNAHSVAGCLSASRRDLGHNASVSPIK